MRFSTADVTERHARYKQAYNDFVLRRAYKFVPGERLTMCLHCYFPRLDHVYIPGTQGEYKCLFQATRFELGCTAWPPHDDDDYETSRFELVYPAHADDE